MLNSINNTSPSFGASFFYTGMTDELGVELSPSSKRKIVKEDLFNDIAEFLEFIKTKEGEKILDKLPKEDVIEFSVKYKPLGIGADKTPAALKPRVSISHNDYYSLTETLNTSNKSTIEAFKEWVDETLEDEKQTDSKKDIYDLLFTPFTINEPDIREKDGVFSKKAGELDGTPDGGHFHKPGNNDLFNLSK